MTLVVVTLVVLAWVACGVVAFGGVYAHLGHDYGYDRETLAFSVGFSLLGPAALAVSIFGTGFWQHGWRLIPPTALRGRTP